MSCVTLLACMKGLKRCEFLKKVVATEVDVAS